MDVNILDITVLNEQYQKFIKAQLDYKNEKYSLFSNGYINQCSDSSLMIMAQNLDREYQTIYLCYQTISKWWDEYLKNLKSTENIISQKSGRNLTEGSLASYASKFPALPTFTANLADLLNPAYIIDVVGVVTTFQNMKDSLFSKESDSNTANNAFSFMDKLDAKNKTNVKSSLDIDSELTNVITSFPKGLSFDSGQETASISSNKNDFHQMSYNTISDNYLNQGNTNSEMSMGMSSPMFYSMGNMSFKSDQSGEKSSSSSNSSFLASKNNNTSQNFASSNGVSKVISSDNSNKIDFNIEKNINWQAFFELQKQNAEKLSKICKQTIKDLQNEKKNQERDFQAFLQENNQNLISGDSFITLTPEEYEAKLIRDIDPLSCYEYDKNGNETYIYEKKYNEVKQKVKEEYTPKFNEIFLEKMGISYDQYKEKISQLDNDILSLKASKYSYDQQLKVYPYLSIMETKEYQDFSKNYQNHFVIEDIDVNAPIKAGQNPVEAADIWVQSGKSLDDQKFLFFNSNILKNERYESLTDANKMMYNFLFQEKGWKDAEQYILDIEDGINQVEAQKASEKFIKSITDSNGTIYPDAWNIFKTSKQGIGDGIETFEDGISNVFKKDGLISTNQYTQMLIVLALDKKKILTGTYEISVSAGNMAPSIAIAAVSGGLGATSATASTIGYSFSGLSIFGNSKNQALVSGNNLLYSSIYGAGNGLSELGLGKLLGNIGILNNDAKFTVQRIFNEGAEEFFQEYVDAGMRNTLFGEKINANDLLGDAGKSFLYGVILSTITTGPEKMVEIYYNNKNYNFSQNELCELETILENNPQNQKAMMEEYFIKNSAFLEEGERQPLSQSSFEFIDSNVNQETKATTSVKGFFTNLFNKLKDNSVKLKDSIIKSQKNSSLENESYIIDSIMTKYTELMNSDKRLPNYLSKGKNGEEISIPNDLNDAYLKLKNLEQELNNHDNQRVQNIIQSGSLSEIMEEYDRLMKNQELVQVFDLNNSSVSTKVPEYLSRDYNNLQSILERLSNLTEGRGDPYQKNKAKFFQPEDYNIDQTMIQYTELLNSDSRLPNLLSKGKNGEAISIPNELNRVYLKLRSLEQDMNLYEDLRIQKVNQNGSLTQIVDEYNHLMKNPELVKIFDLSNAGINVQVPKYLSNDYHNLQSIFKKLSNLTGANVASNYQNIAVSSTKTKTESLLQLLENNPQLKRYLLSKEETTLIIPNELEEKYQEMRQLVSDIEKNGFSDFTSNLRNSLEISQSNEYLIVSDLHGDMNLFDQMKQKLKSNSNAHFYVLGDAMDRGVSGLEILLQIKEFSDQGRISYLPGNHDVEFYHYLRGITDKNQNQLFKDSEGFYKVNKFVNETNRLQNFDSIIDDLYKKGIIHKKVNLTQLGSWLGSQPIQKQLGLNGKEYGIAHAIFDNSLFQIDSNFNLAKFYQMELSNKNKSILNRAKNIFWYRRDDNSTHFADISFPKNMEMIVGHIPQSNANRSFLDKLNQYNANYIDTHNANFSAYDLNLGRPFTLHEILSFNILDNTLIQSPESIKIEKLKINQWLFDQNLKKLNASLSERNDPGVVNLFLKSLEKVYNNVDDSKIESIIENLYKLKNISLKINDANETIKMNYDGALIQDKTNTIFLNSLDINTNRYISLNHEMGHLLHSMVDNAFIPSSFNDVLNGVKTYINRVTMPDVIQYITETNGLIRKGESSYLSKLKNDNKLHQELNRFITSELKKIDISQYQDYFNAKKIPIDVKNVTETKLNDFILQREMNLFARKLMEKDYPGVSAVHDMISSVFGSANITFDNGFKVTTSYSHSDAYYKRGNDVCYSEMVANYFQLKMDGCSKEINLLRKLLGENWYNMMEEQMNQITIKMMEMGI